MSNTPTPVIDAYLARSATQTLRNGEHLRGWDAFLVWRKDMLDYFAKVKDYAGYPSLPDAWLKGEQIYSESDEHSKHFIANTAITSFLEALRHWKTDLDMLYPDNKTQGTFFPLT